MNINALYESVTNGIIKEMKAGAVPRAKPGMTSRSHGSVMPHNLATVALQRHQCHSGRRPYFEALAILCSKWPVS
jgi:hypothetical protein